MLYHHSKYSSVVDAVSAVTVPVDIGLIIYSIYKSSRVNSAAYGDVFLMQFENSLKGISSMAMYTYMFNYV